MLHMIVEQTANYPMRMEFVPERNEFRELNCQSLASQRNFTKPYGWIKESGTPPAPHWDCILMSDGQFELGDEVSVRVVGMFKRNDKDHKYVAVESDSPVDDFEELSDLEKEELYRLYPRIRDGEGWFGRGEALACMQCDEKAL